MDIKVGDIVKYRNENVRVLQWDSHAIKLSLFGWVDRDISQIELVESITISELRDGDFVFVHDIPNDEKDAYGCCWFSQMDNYVNKIVRVKNPIESPHSDNVVIIDGWLFCTYHLEKIEDYDIV